MPDAILAWAQAKQSEFITFLGELVRCESPSDDPAAVERFVHLIREHTADLATSRIIPGSDGFGPHLQLEFNLAGGAEEKHLLVLGHSDTVYPTGTIATMPYVERDGLLYGPGVFDMKGGVAMYIYAMRALCELGVPVRRNVVLQLNADEEVGSPTSRRLTEAEAARSEAVLVVEPAAGPEGKAKTGRKGVGDYTVRVTGKSAHAGLDFTSGASAILELAKQIDWIATFTDLERGITVNPGIVSGGTRGNVVAAHAWCEFDFRIAQAADADTLQQRFLSLQPFDQRCSIQVEGGLNRPPLERTEGVLRLYQTARSIAEELGVTLGEATVGGGSDGNFTAGLGIPTLDGMGAVGDGAHSPDEHIRIDRIADRVTLLARLTAAI